MNSVAGALICFACAAQNFSFWNNLWARFIGFGCVAGGIYLLWSGA